MATRLPLLFLNRSRLWLLALWLGCAGLADAATVQGTVTDEDGEPVADAVVSLSLLQGTPPAPAPGKASMDQAGRRFVPHVLPIYQGTAVVFPNSDNIRHHVYSFSPGNRFEIKLYSGVPLTPMVFEHPGVVVLGCNIHDWMVGYIYVADTPYFAKSDAEGHWRIELPAHGYRWSLWHPDLDTKIAVPDKTLTVQDGPAQAVDQVIALKSNRRSGEPPDSAQDQPY